MGSTVCWVKHELDKKGKNSVRDFQYIIYVSYSNVLKSSKIYFTYMGHMHSNSHWTNVCTFTTHIRASYNVHCCTICYRKKLLIILNSKCLNYKSYNHHTTSFYYIISANLFVTAELIIGDVKLNFNIKFVKLPLTNSTQLYKIYVSKIYLYQIRRHWVYNSCLPVILNMDAWFHSI